MAIAWGNKAGSRERWQAWCEAEVESESPTAATIVCRAYWHSIAYGFNVFGNGTASIAENSKNSGTVTMYSATGQTVDMLVVEHKVTVSKGSEDKDVWCSVSVSITGGFQNGTSTCGVNVKVGAIDINKPKPPLDASAVRVSDTSASVTWSGNYTNWEGLYPWTSVLVERSDDGGDYVQIADLDWDAVNYTDKSISAGHAYGYRVRSANPEGYSEYSDAGSVYTTPAPPKSVTLSKVDGTLVHFEMEGACHYADAHLMQTSMNGGDWGDEAEVGESGDFDATGSVSVRVRSRKGDLHSSFRESNVVTTITPPLAPSLSGISGPYATESTITVSWVPNHPDGSRQSSAQVEFSGPLTQVVDVEGAATELTVAANTKGSWLLRVRTKGLHDEWGAWSAYVAFTVADPPHVLISYPSSDGAVVDAAPLMVEFGATDETGVSSASLTLLRPDGIKIGSVDVTDMKPVSIGSYQTLENGSAYTLILDVRGGSGLTARATRTFRTQWTEPVSPIVEVTSDGDLACHIRVGNGAYAYSVEGSALIGPIRSGEGELPLLGTLASDGDELAMGDAAKCVRFEVERVFAGGVAPISSDMLDSHEAIDRVPPLNEAFLYRVTGYSESGTSSRTDAPAKVRARGMALNFGQDGSTALVIESGSYSNSCKRGFSAFHFADGGENGYLPVSYPIDEVDISTSVSFDLLRPQYDMFRGIIGRHWIGWWRGHCGERAYGPMEFQSSIKKPGVFSCSANVTHDVFEEPANG